MLKPILPLLQWQDVCLVAAVRYCPGLLLLASALGTGMLGKALPLPWLAAIAVAVISSLTPIPSQVCACDDLGYNEICQMSLSSYGVVSFSVVLAIN